MFVSFVFCLVNAFDEARVFAPQLFNVLVNLRDETMKKPSESAKADTAKRYKNSLIHILLSDLIFNFVPSGENHRATSAKSACDEFCSCASNLVYRFLVYPSLGNKNAAKSAKSVSNN